MTARHTSVINHYITFEGGDEFETLHKPDMMIDPHLAINSQGEAIVTYAVRDLDRQSPREEYDHFATLVQQDRSQVDVDQPDLDIAEANDYFDDKSKIQRYLSIFRPDILHYEDYVTIGSGYGYAYVTKANWERAMGETYDGPRTPADLLRNELDEYEAWVSGDVYGIAQERYHREDDGTWVRDTGDDVWGYIGMEYVQGLVSEGEF